MNNQIDDDLVLDGLTPEDLIESGRKLRKQLLDSLTPQERLLGMSLEQRLAGMTTEELTTLLDLVEHQLRQIKAEK